MAINSIFFPVMIGGLVPVIDKSKILKWWEVMGSKAKMNQALPVCETMLEDGFPSV